MAKAQAIEAQDALKHFGGKGIKVQVAAPIEVKGEDGKKRPAYKTEMESLHAGHVLAARDYGDHVTVVTIDGCRYEAAKGRAAKGGDGENGGGKKD